MIPVDCIANGRVESIAEESVDDAALRLDRSLLAQSSSTYDDKKNMRHTISSSMATAVSTGCSNAVFCLSEAQKCATKFVQSTLMTAAGFLVRPLATAAAASQRNQLNVARLIKNGTPSVTLLGITYDLREKDEFDALLEDFGSRILFTYRRDFEPIQSFPSNAFNDCRSAESNAANLKLDVDAGRSLQAESEPSRGEAASAKKDSFNVAVPVANDTVPFIRRVLCQQKAGLIVSDNGWGCMIRTTQMALAQTLIKLRLGRSWRRKRKKLIYVHKNESSSPQKAKSVLAERIEQVDHVVSSVSSKYYELEGISKLSKPSESNSSDKYLSFTLTRILRLFSDSSLAPLSLHNIALASQKAFGIAVGDWLGPTTCAQIAALLMSSKEFAPHFPDVVPIVFPDGLLVNAVVRSALCHNCKWKGQQAVLLILCMKLGSDHFNSSRYQTSLAKCFDLPQFQGIAGGGSLTSAHYFIGVCAQGLLFLDPHRVVQTAYNLETEEKSQAFPGLSPHIANTFSDMQAPEKCCKEGGVVASKGNQDDVSEPTDASVQSSLHSVAAENSLHSLQSDVFQKDSDFKKPDKATTYYNEKGYGLSWIVSPELYEDVVCSEELQFFPSPIAEKSGDNGVPHGLSVLPWASLNPSMALYFLCESIDDYDAMLAGLQEAGSGVPELFEVQEVPFDYSKAAGFELNDFNFDEQNLDE